jgi:hypothetical protein
MPTVHMQLRSFDKLSASEEDALAQDERWILAQRIVRSKGFQRAAQLRAILLYASKFAILGGGEPLREDDLAREALGRRADFDPAYDNIVRVQVSHLRRKLAEYFAEDGKHEAMVIDIPKGSYLPHFEPMLPQEVVTLHPDRDADSKVLPLQPDREEETISSGSVFKPVRALRPVLLWSMSVVLIVCAALYLTLHKSAVQPERAAIPKIFLPLIEQGNEVAIVLPDTSLMVIQQILNTEIAPLEYIATDFPRGQVEKVSNPELRAALMFLGTKRTTSFRESGIALDWIESLQRAGLHGSLRYSRDLHVRDLNDGNIVLIGSRRSNPWMSMFTSSTNFQFVERNGNQGYSFINAKPLPGEEAQYRPHHVGNQDINYVDIALVRNFGEKGFVLLINGSDTQANESAARFLLHGKLPSAIEDQLTRKDFSGLEIFLRGAHLDSEANNTFEMVAYRTPHA